MRDLFSHATAPKNIRSDVDAHSALRRSEIIRKMVAIQLFSVYMHKNQRVSHPSGMEIRGAGR